MDKFPEIASVKPRMWRNGSAQDADLTLEISYRVRTRNTEGMYGALRILIVEDNPDDAELLLRELRRGGIDPIYRRVLTPEDLERALEEPWDVVFCDWDLPRFNGLAAFKITRAKNPDVPFIIVSGTISEEIAVGALKAGVHDFLSKGKFARLIPAVERELREAENRKQQRLADAKLADKQREIEQSEILLRLVVDSVPDGIVVVGQRGEMKIWNAAANRILGMVDMPTGLEERIRELGFFKSDRSTPLDREAFPLFRALRNQSVDGEEVYMKRGDEDGRWLSINARPLHDKDGQVVGALAVFRETTNEKAAQEQLMVSDRMASLGMLAAGVGHEINNPLAAVVANIDLAHQAAAEKHREEPDEQTHEQVEMLKDALAGANQIREIVKDLRVLARHEDVEPAPVNVERVLEASVRLAWNEIRHRAKLVKSFQAPPAALGSESRLSQVFLNLLVNAAHAIPAGEAEQHSIRLITAEEPDGMVSVAITDSGSGMTEETRRSIFRPFFTTKAVGVGTGLGLAICDRIVTRLGGRIEVSSTLGRGSTFKVILPRAMTKGATPSGAAVSKTTSPARRGSVLVVDDELLVVNCIRRSLARHHDVVTTTVASEALDRVKNGEKFDVIFCDLMMPNMTGWDLYGAIKAVAPDLADRMVFLTGGTFTAVAREFLESVPNKRVDKPFDPRALSAMVSDRVA